MKKFNKGIDYFTVPEFAKVVAKELGRPRDKRLKGIIYNELLSMIRNGELPFERHGSRMYKVKRCYVKFITNSYKYLMER